MEQPPTRPFRLVQTATSHLCKTIGIVLGKSPDIANINRQHVVSGGTAGAASVDVYVTPEREGVPCWLFKEGLMKPAGQMAISESQIGDRGLI